MMTDARLDPFPYYADNSTMTFKVPDPDPWTISFANGAKLKFWKDGRVTFEGNPDEAAKVFYEHLVKAHFANVRGGQE
jgi:hypothetical protein